MSYFRTQSGDKGGDNPQWAICTKTRRWQGRRSDFGLSAGGWTKLTRWETGWIMAGQTDHNAERGCREIPCNPLFLLVPPAGIGPAAPGLGILCSIHLSYWSGVAAGQGGCGPEGCRTSVEGRKNTRSSVPVQAFPAGPGVGGWPRWRARPWSGSRLRSTRRRRVRSGR